MNFVRWGRSPLSQEGNFSRFLGRYTATSRKDRAFFAGHGKIRKCEQDVQATFVHSNATVLNFPEAEGPFDHAEDVLHAKN